MFYPNGDKRTGTLCNNGTGEWIGVASFTEAGGFSAGGRGNSVKNMDAAKDNKWTEYWISKNGSTTYEPEARIFKSVINKVNKISMYSLILLIYLYSNI